MENLGRENWASLKWVLRYLRETSSYCITCNGCSDFVCAYVNLDFLGDLDKRRSALGYVLTLVGGPICWTSKLQNIVSLSTTKAEYIVSSHACKEEIWLNGLLGGFGKM